MIYVYASIPGGSLYFSSGAMIFHYRHALLKLFSQAAILSNFYLHFAILTAVTLVTLVASLVFSDSNFNGLVIVLTLIPAAGLIISVLKKPWMPLGKKADKILGDLSYPVYLSHWVFGLIFAFLFGLPAPERSLLGLIVFICAYISTVLFSLLIVKFVDEPVERVRTLIRGRAEKTKLERETVMHSFSNPD